MKRILISIALLPWLAGQGRIGDWTDYTSPLEIRDLVQVGRSVFAATAGGLLIFDSQEKSFSTLTKIDGLLGTDLNALAVDSDSLIWIGGGSSNGFIQVYDPGETEFVNSFDLDLSQIEAFAVADSIIFGVYLQNQDWGLIEFIRGEDGFEYRDVVKNWPYSVAGITGVALLGDTVFAGTDAGVLIADWRNSNLKDPSNWSRPFPELDGEISVLREANGKILVASDQKVYSITSAGVTLLRESNVDFLDLAGTEDDSFWGVVSDRVLHGTSKIYYSSYTLTSILPAADGDVYLGTMNGVAKLDQATGTFSRWIPNAPLTNHFTALTILDDGRLVAGSNSGLAILEFEGWRNIIGHKTIQTVHSDYSYDYYTADTVLIDFGEFIADMEQGPDGLLYCAVRGVYPEPRSHGGGIIIIDIDDPASFTLVDTAYLDWNLDEHMSVRDIEFDAAGNLWAANTFATHDKDPIAVRTASGNWGNFSSAESGGLVSLTPTTIGFDAWGRTWIGSFEDDNINPASVTDGGLVMLDFTGDPTQPESSSWKKLTVSDDPVNNTVWSLAVNQSNVLYFLSPVGLTGISLQSSATNPEAYRGFTYFPNISYGKGSRLKLDPRDNIWTTSSTQGIHVLLSNATYWPDINGLTAENSYLLSNEVTDIDFNSKQGKAVLTTSRGISVLKIPFAEEKRSFSNVDVFPSPFHIPSERPMVVDGLKDESSIKIMTLTGRVLRDLTESNAGISGYQAFWDGKDNSGRWVGSGVYLISIYTPGGSSSFEKITVIRH